MTVAGCQRFTFVILATQEAEIRKIAIQSQPGPSTKKNREFQDGG
jgi:hypothetical protein